MPTIKDIIKSTPKDQIDDIYELLINVLGKSKEYLFANPDTTLSHEKVKDFSSQLKRHNQGEPLAHILGYKYFYDSKFEVNKHTLIPRPETETIIEKILEIISNTDQSSLNILEIGTGSGCISISILKEVIKKPARSPSLYITATDISKEALEVAKINKKNILPNLEENSLEFKHADIVPSDTNTKFDLIVSNPPYITEEEYKNLDKSVKDYEPRIALETRENGLEIYKRILQKTKRHTKTRTTFLFEINPKNAPKIKKMIKSSYPSSHPQTIDDQYLRKRFIKFDTQPT